MTARVLVVDDLEPNVKLLEAKLTAEYFEVVTGSSGPEAIEVARREQPDIILLDVMMPGMDGYEACRLLKADPLTEHIPVVMVTALDQQSDRIEGLDAGADDFLTKPVEDVALFARVRSLARLKLMTDELRLQHQTIQSLGIDAQIGDVPELDEKDRVLIIDDEGEQADKIIDVLGETYDITVEGCAESALRCARGGDFDMIVVNMAMESADALRLCSAIRALDEVRLTPLLAIVRSSDTRKLVRALEMGVSDYVSRPIDPNELEARVRTQMRRKRYVDRLRAALQVSLELAVKDQLTGLFNRRYLASHLGAMFQRAQDAGRELALLFIDIDHFKQVNDQFGHEAGDEVVAAFARRITHNVRGVDLACRYGGEEFVVALPNTDRALAMLVADRLRVEIADAPFVLEDGRELNITASLGVAATDDQVEGEDSPRKLLQRADEAVLAAKGEGRNRIRAA